MVGCATESVVVRELPAWILGVSLALLLAVSLLWVRWSRPRSVVWQAAAISLAYLALWQCAVQVAYAMNWAEVRVALAQYGLGGLFLIGLGWVVWLVELASQKYDLLRLVSRPHRQPDGSDATPPVAPVPHKRIWNPLDTEAWYYGGKSRKLNQSLLALGSYSLAFVLLTMSAAQMQGCKEIYELPAGGGQSKASMPQAVRIQKVVKKKFVINPFSAIIFNSPIDEVKLQLQEITKHAYKIGYGSGDGAGFGGGTLRGKVRFIRLQIGGDWNQDFGVVPI